MKTLVVDISAGLQSGTGIGAYSRGLSKQILIEAKSRDWAVRLFSGSGKWLRRYWRYFSMPQYDFFSGKADLYHFPDFIIPTRLSGKKVVTIHDFAFAHLPQVCEIKNRLYLQQYIPQTLGLADAIVVPTQFTKTELLTFYPVAGWESKIHVIGQGIEPIFPPQMEPIDNKLYEGKPFFLFVGTQEPRKNLLFLLQAFAEVRRKIPELQLVLVGNSGWGPPLPRINPGDGVHVVSYLSEMALQAHYQHAIGFVFPSLYEGFGRPPLEAMQQGLPVLISDEPWAQEVCGSAAIYCGLASIDSWIVAMENLVQDASLRENLSVRGRKHAARFTWQETLRPLWDLYDRLM